MKKIISAVLLLAAVVLIALALIMPNWMEKIKNNPNEDNTLYEEKEHVQDKKYKTPMPGDTVRMQISPDKLIRMNTPTVIKWREYIFEYCVDSAYYSRKLSDDYKVRQALVQYFGSDIMSEDGTLLKDKYYVYVDITVKNVGDNSVMLAPKSTEIIFIDDAGVATDEYNVRKDSYYLMETSEVKRFDELNSIKAFGAQQTSSYQQVFIVDENELTRNDIYIRANHDLRGEEALDNADQRYIHLDLEGKEDAAGVKQ